MILFLLACTRGAATPQPTAPTTAPTTPTTAPTTPTTAPASPPTEVSVDLLNRYQAWATQQDPTVTGAEEPTLTTGAFHYFSVKTPRGRRLEAVVSADTLITRAGTGDWAAFLQSAPADTMGRRLAWLHGTASLWGPDSPEASPTVGAPTVRADGDTVRFTGWYLFQPDSTVSRLDVVATAKGATLTWTPVGH